MFFHQSKCLAVEGIKGDARAENIISGHSSPSQIVTIPLFSLVPLQGLDHAGSFQEITKNRGWSTEMLDHDATEGALAARFIARLVELVQEGFGLVE